MYSTQKNHMREITHTVSSSKPLEGENQNVGKNG
jgi:hypothetical protein